MSAASSPDLEKSEEACLHGMLLFFVTATLESHLSVIDFAAFLRVMVRGHALATEGEQPRRW